MGKRSGPTPETVLDQQLVDARSEFETARTDAERIANDETAHLASDEEYLRWTRQKRLAEQRQSEQQALINKLKRDIETNSQAETLAAYTARYDAAANRNREVAEMYATDLLEAWAIIARVLKAAAEAEIETASVLSIKPAGFQPSRPIGNPESVRRRDAVHEEILSSDIVNLRVDALTGAIFADQSATQAPGRKVKTKKFVAEKYQPFRAASHALPFWRDLVFPRLGNFGGPLFDGTRAHEPQAVLEQLSARRELHDYPLTRIKPLDMPAAQATFSASPPAM